MGDLNARTGTSPEYTEHTLDQVASDQYGINDDVISYINNFQELQNHGFECERKSQDKNKNNFGYQLLKLCQNNNLYISNGRLNSEESSACTCIKGSVIDYLIGNINGMLLVNNFRVHYYSPLLSDVHCALSFSINVNFHVHKSEKCIYSDRKWEPERKDIFVNNINRHKLAELSLKLDNLKKSSLNKNEMESVVSTIKNIFQESAKCLLKQICCLKR